MGFLRFVVAQRDLDSGVDGGLFAAAYALRESSNLSEPNRQSLTKLLSWFDEHLSTPGRFNRSSSKGYYRRSAKGISWFRDTADEHISRMYQLKRIVETNGHSVGVVKQERVGYVVYEDEYQVVAEPFADTKTSA